jgi:P-type Ca2+ transporter type 2C
MTRFTGTLTKNEQTVTELYTPDGETHVLDPATHAFRPTAASRRLLEVGAICNDAVPLSDGSGRFAGQATDVAFAVAYAGANPGASDPRASFTRTAERPFSSETKSMSVSGSHAAAGGNGNGSGWETTYVKGAPDALLQRCRAVYAPEGAARTMDAQTRTKLGEVADAMGARGLRVVALAYADGPPTTSTGVVSRPTTPGGERSDLVFVGLAGMRDPPRPGAQDAVARLRAGGVKVVMITGDAPATARAVAAELGILTAGEGTVLTGAEVDAMDERALGEVVGRVGVYARTTPAHKMRIVKAWQARGAVVAMTGDGGSSFSHEADERGKLTLWK